MTWPTPAFCAPALLRSSEPSREMIRLLAPGLDVHLDTHRAMQPVDYEPVAASYDRRYATNDFDGITRSLRVFVADATSVAEVGCGTGHWLALAASLIPSAHVVGLDRATAMLAAARGAHPGMDVLRGTADSLPWRDVAFDRVFCVNALHHFPDAVAFYREAARVLRPGGTLLTIGLDPHTGTDQWWIYDYFPGALVADRRRYPSAPSIQAGLRAAGFTGVDTFVAQHLPAELTFSEAMTRGFLERRSTSQLLVIDDAEWERGLNQLVAERPVLRADLRLYATTARKL